MELFAELQSDGTVHVLPDVRKTTFVVPPPPALAVTVTVALALGEVPPVPVHIMEYVVLVVGETETLPEVAEAVKPVPVQLVAFVLLHVSVDD
jgi:hypothetical protein